MYAFPQRQQWKKDDKRYLFGLWNEVINNTKESTLDHILLNKYIGRTAPPPFFYVPYYNFVAAFISKRNLLHQY